MLACLLDCRITESLPTEAQITEGLPDTLSPCAHCDGLRCKGECQ